MLGEITDKSNQAVAFSTISVSTPYPFKIDDFSTMRSLRLDRLPDRSISRSADRWTTIASRTPYSATDLQTSVLDPAPVLIAVLRGSRDFSVCRCSRMGCCAGSEDLWQGYSHELAAGLTYFDVDAAEEVKKAKQRDTWLPCESVAV